MGVRSIRPADEHLPVIIGVRRGHEQHDSEAALQALRRAGFQATPIGTLAVTSLAVVRMRATALGSDDVLLREKIIDVADRLEALLPAVGDVAE